MTTLRQIKSADTSLITDLCQLLIDSVHNGASIGFLAPLSEQTATDYWQKVLASLNGSLALWVAESDGKIVGSVQLDACQKQNGRHRADLQKLFVLSTHRGLGIASQLMAAAETFARKQKLTLLVLDTEAGSHAESVYQHLGWTKVGEIPNYAAIPNGELIATAYYYKQLVA
jgi:acetyltransferase